MTSPSLAEAIPPGASLLIDTSVALAYLTGTEPISPAATQLFDEFLATGRDRGALSMITVGEILVRPFRAGPAALAIAEGFLRHFAELQLIAVDYGVAREAALISASGDLRMPDALILSSAMACRADLLVTNDRSLAAAARRFDIGVCFVGDLLLAGALREKTGRTPPDESWETLRQTAWQTPDPDRPR